MSISTLQVIVNGRWMGDIYIANRTARCYSACPKGNSWRRTDDRGSQFGAEHLPMPVFAGLWRR